MAKYNYRDISSLDDIKTKRQKANISKEDLARFCGVSVQAVHGWENGLTKKIRQEHYEKLSQILDIK